MMSVREPILKSVAIADLRPTQMTVGIREVKERRKRWRDESKKKGAEFPGKHMIPDVLGPEDRHFIDHHHLVRALHDEGVEDVLVTAVKNLRTLEPDSFWFVLDNHSWMHPYDDEGRLRPYKDAHSWVQLSQWVQHGCSAVPAAAAQVQVRHREAFSPKSSTRRRGEAQGQS